MKKVFTLCFHSVVNGNSASPMATAIYKAALECTDNCIFYFSSVDKEMQNIKGTPIFVRGLLWCVRHVFSISQFLSKYTRTVCELIVDYYYSFLLSKEKEDFVLLIFFYTPRSTSVAKSKGKKVILLSGNHDDNLYYRVVKKEMERVGFQSDPYVNVFRNRIYNKMIKNVDTIVSPHKLVLDLYPDNFEKIKTGTYYVPIGYKVKVNFTLSNPVRIGFIGYTNTLLKGLQILADAISKSQHRIILMIAGPVSSEIKELVNLTGIDVQYLGFLDTKKKNEFFNSLDLFIAPSLYDAAPTTVTEALECCLPVILSDGCGSKECFEKYSQYFVFKTLDSDDLKDKIDFAIDNYNKIVEATKELKDDYFGANKQFLTFTEYFNSLAQ